MKSEQLLIYSILLNTPSYFIIALIFRPNNIISKIWSIFSPILNLILSIILLETFQDKYFIELLNIKILFIEPIFLLFLVFVNFMWIVCNIYIIGHVKQYSYGEDKLFKLHSLISFSILFSLLTLSSANYITLLFGYEMLTFTTYFLVKFDNTEESKTSSTYYLFHLVMASVIFLIPFLGFVFYGNNLSTYNSLNYNLEITTLTLFLIFFGSAKAAMMPFHSWLIKAMVAPIPVSALLHAVAVVKTGILLIVKFIVYQIGLERMGSLLANFSLFTLIIYFSIAITILFGAYLAYRHNNIKTILAYSTISQLGMIILPMIISNMQAIKIIIMQLITHGMAKITLFFFAGENYHQKNSLDISSLKGFYHNNKILSMLVLLASLSLIGFPIFPGFWNKIVLISLLSDSNPIWVLITTMSSLCTAAYLIKILGKIFAKPEIEETNNLSVSNPYVIIACFISISGLVITPFLSDYITFKLSFI